MCGFAGVVAWDERFRVTRETLMNMSARIAHRGPDGGGLYVSPDTPITSDRPQIALAHRRLAILDPDPRANQPFTDNAGRWLVFNGEIYNFRELRAELSKLQPGYAWRTNCDTEVLLVAYDQWGEKCVEHLNGMFAFAVWDEPCQSLFLARDRMGQKPLYVAYVHWYAGSSAIPVNIDAMFERVRRDPPERLVAIAFASEISAVLELPWVDREMSSRSLVGYLRLGYVSHPSSIYRSIGQLSPGNFASITSARSSTGKYFDAATGLTHGQADRADDVARTPEQARRRVRQAVARQLVSDVTLGCFLSGGIDSSIVAACMRAEVPEAQEVLTFSIGFDDARYDESEYAAAVAAHLGTRHHRFTVKPDAAADLPRLAAVFGEPFGDSSALPTHYLARETRAHVKVALSGDGGDELFGGYDRYRAMLIARRLRLATTPLPWKALAPLFAAMPGGHPKSTANRLRRFAASLGLSAKRRYMSYVSVFSDELILQLLAAAPAPIDLLNLPIESYFESLNGVRAVVPAASATDRGTYLPDDLLTKVDRASMLHALEVRSPFMDHELVQFAARLTTDQLLKGGPKRMLREAFANDLPAWVFKRKKMGFAVPIGDWFRGELRSMLRDHLFAAGSFASRHFNKPVLERLVEEHETGRTDHSQRLYALLMLELWWSVESAK